MTEFNSAELSNKSLDFPAFYQCQGPLGSRAKSTIVWLRTWSSGPPASRSTESPLAYDLPENYYRKRPRESS